MKNLYDSVAYSEIIKRIDSLTPTSQAKWGKMNAAQMLAHCAAILGDPTGDKPIKRMWLGYLIAPFVKKNFYNDAPWSKGSPTNPDFVIKDERNFEQERERLKGLVTLFHQNGPSKVEGKINSFFGKVTPEQWGLGMYKHLNHHLEQFGA